MARSARHLLRIGLTGNIGAGKSTVASMLQQHGCITVDMDALARELLQHDQQVQRQVVQALGPTVLGDDGAIDRERVAAAVFDDPAARRCLEHILHPRIARLEAQRLEQLPPGPAIVVTEAALLLETGWDAHYDRLVVVVAPERIRFDRLRRRGMSDRDIRARMRAQMPQGQKAKRADYVIDNGGPLGQTRLQVDRLAAELDDELRRRVGALNPGPPRQ